MTPEPLNIFIASPLEPEQVERIRGVDPERLEVVHDPDVLPPKRYEADHTRPADFRRTPEQQARWRSHLGRADILWDFRRATRTAAGDSRMHPMFAGSRRPAQGWAGESKPWACSVPIS